MEKLKALLQDKKLMALIVVILGAIAGYTSNVFDDALVDMLKQLDLAGTEAVMQESDADASVVTESAN